MLPLFFSKDLFIIVVYAITYSIGGCLTFSFEKTINLIRATAKAISLFILNISESSMHLAIDS